MLFRTRAREVTFAGAGENHNERLARIFAAVLLAACVAWYIERAVETFPGAGASDFRWYYAAAQHIVAGQSPYLAVGYLYPPLPAFLFAPFAALDYLPARRTWFLLSHCFLLAAASVLWRRLGGSWRSASVVAFVWASGGAAEENLALGQIGPLLTLMVVVGSFPGRFQAAAISLGFAIKMIPGVLGVTLPLQRRWRSLVWTGILTVLLLGTPWLAVQWWLPGPKSPTSTSFLAGTPTILSWSAPSVALRALHPPGPDGKPPAQWIDNNLAAVHLGPRDRNVSLALSALLMLGGVAILLLVTRGSLASEAVPFASAALIALTLVAAPVCWTHYEVLQYPGAAILLDRAVRERRWLSFLAVVTSWAFLYTVPVTVLRAAYRVHGDWPGSPGFLYFWTSISCLASLSLFTLAIYVVGSFRQRASGDEISF